MKKIIIVLMLTVVFVSGYAQSTLNGRKRIVKSMVSTIMIEISESVFFYEEFQSAKMPSDFTILNVDGYIIRLRQIERLSYRN